MPTGTSQFIKVKTKEGKVLDVATQPYEIGLYVCIYENGRMVDQFGLDMSQEKFIKSLQDNKDLEVLD